MRPGRAAGGPRRAGGSGGPEGPLNLIHTNNCSNRAMARAPGERWMDIQQVLDLVGGRLSPLEFVILRRAADGAA